MKTIAFVVAYYGKFPNYFPVWLNSCRQNPSVDFLIFTDISPKGYVLPPNVRFIPTSFEQLRERFQKYFGFKISLERPYKLCDYKPAYGEALQDYLHDYDFWGHCDIDLIWGNIRHFVTDELLDQYDRICNQGHCSIYRNSPRVNSLYRTLDPHGCYDWHEVYSNDRNYAFDEYGTVNEDGSGGGISLIMERSGERIFSKWLFYDVNVKYQDRFQIELDDHEREESAEQVQKYLHRYYSTDEEAEMQFFERNEDGLYLWYCKDGVIQSKEFLYVHFAKRVIQIPKGAIQSDNYLFLPPAKIKELAEPMTESARLQQMQKNRDAVRRCRRIASIKKNIIVHFVIRAKNKAVRMTKSILYKNQK